ncbi:hypothetical protein CK203_109293 [Vitis vinifera]|uniref:Uncharacterized protein n=1 Tax=Vitis vinifera TaxID=29760 RepID=A0A438CEJ0_VITVI|nr:hypothetical protein CK203_109293 [Vitis vinifera]
METWVYNIVISLCVAALLKSLYDFIFPKLNLPPGPTTVPFVGNLLWLLKSFSELEPILRNLHAKYGPIVTSKSALVRPSSSTPSPPDLGPRWCRFSLIAQALPTNRI